VLSKLTHGGATKALVGVCAALALDDLLDGSAKRVQESVADPRDVCARGAQGDFPLLLTVFAPQNGLLLDVGGLAVALAVAGGAHVSHDHVKCEVADLNAVFGDWSSS
jgi:hypothetical protein